MSTIIQDQKLNNLRSKIYARFEEVETRIEDLNSQVITKHIVPPVTQDISGMNKSEMIAYANSYILDANKIIDNLLNIIDSESAILNIDQDIIFNCFKLNGELKSVNIKNNTLKPIVNKLSELGISKLSSYENMVNQKAELETELKAKQEAELEAKQEAELKAKQEAKEEAERVAKEVVENKTSELELLGLFNKEKEDSIIAELATADAYKNGITFHLGKDKSVRTSKLIPNIVRFLDSINNLDKWYFKYSIEGRWSTMALNSEGIAAVKNMLDKGSFSNFFNNMSKEEDQVIMTSDSGNVNLTMMYTIDMFDSIIITPFAKGSKVHGKQIYSDNGGAFFDSTLVVNLPQELVKVMARYQVFDTLLESGKPRQELESNCLIYAFEQSGLFDVQTLTSMKAKCFTRIVSKKQLDKLGKDYQIRIEVYKQTPNRHIESVVRNKDKAFGCTSGWKYDIKLGLIDKHYILLEQVNISSYFIKNMSVILEHCNKKNKTVTWAFSVVEANFKSNVKKAHMKSLALLHLLIDLGYTKKMTFSERGVLQTDLYQYVSTDITNLDFHKSDMKPIIAKEVKSDKVKSGKTKKSEQELQTRRVYYADCESDVVTSNVHTAYCISYCERNSDNIKCIFGADCIDKFFDELEDKSIVYFHNLGYDARLMNNLNIIRAIDKSGRVMTQTVKVDDRTITLKDSFSLISMPLKAFPKMFKLEGIQKEIFPYRYYTMQRISQNVGSISEAGRDELGQYDETSAKMTWNQELFIECLERSGARIDAETFDMKKYAEFYCNQDVRILKDGFNKFRIDTLKEPIALDVDMFISAPSLANAYFTEHVYSKTNNMQQYSGVPRAFIQKAVIGGRCMIKDNIKHHVNDRLQDFDAVSLYPSAMNRLYTIEGEPELLDSVQLNTKFLLECTAGENEQVSEDKPIAAYVVDIVITKVGKHLHFPLISYKDANTKTNQNVNKEGVKMTVDNITLEDLVKYQNVECDVLRGYYWLGNKDFKIRSVITELFNLRLQYKKDNNPVQEVIKLIMNSAYGKTIQQPIRTDTVYKKVQTMSKDGIQLTPCNAYCEKNHAKIREIYDISKNICGIVVNKQIDNFYSNTLIGVQILSMSKRIMNEVMCLAEDLNVDIYYQDTDSMHISEARLPVLAEAFKAKFNRELIGSKMGQFHNDFTAIKGNNVVSVESYFIGKKCYVDKLVSDIDQGYHIRMKGVDLNCVRMTSNSSFNNNMMNLYDHLFEGKSITFNLLDTKPRFKMNKERTVSNVAKFKRCIKFTGPTVTV